MPKRPRDLRRRPKWTLPKTYREFLHKAMADSRDREPRHRPSAKFSPACMANHHSGCNGFVPRDPRSRDTSDPDECICHCHDQTLVDLA